MFRLPHSAISSAPWVSDLAGGFCLLQSCQRAVGLQRLLQFRGGGVVDLIQVDVVGAQIFKAGLDVRCRAFFGAIICLGSDHELVPDALQGIAQVFLADGVSPGGVDKIHACLQKLTDHNFCAFCVDLLNGNAAKAHAGDLKSGLAENSVLHSVFLL